MSDYGPRIWDAPPEPEGVTAVVDRYGCSLERRADGWWWTEMTMQSEGMPWSKLFWMAAPLTEEASQ